MTKLKQFKIIGGVVYAENEEKARYLATVEGGHDYFKLKEIEDKYFCPNCQSDFKNQNCMRCREVLKEKQT